MLRVGWAQLAFGACSTPDEARARAVEALGELAARGADVAVLPELHAGAYPAQVEDPAVFALAEPLDGPMARALAEAARTHGVVVVGSLFERRAEGLYHNTAVIFDADGRLVHVYRKTHIPHDPDYFEKYYFAPGTGPLVPAETRAGRIGVLVCWDQWFPEAARLVALADADVLVYPTAIGWYPPDTRAEKSRQLDAWITVQRAHAIANTLPVVAVNRVGFEAGPRSGIEFWGSSFAADSLGALVAQAPSDREDVRVVELDLARRAEDRLVWPFFRDRRPDLYGPLLRRWRGGAGPDARLEEPDSPDGVL